jgi:hypothetical protein
VSDQRLTGVPVSVRGTDPSKLGARPVTGARHGTAGVESAPGHRYAAGAPVEHQLSVHDRPVPAGGGQAPASHTPRT